MIKSSVDNLEYISIKPINHPIDADVTIPGAKSLTHRAFIISALAEGDSKIENPAIAEDTLLTLEALKLIGVQIEKNVDSYLIHGTRGNLSAPENEIMLNNSGSTLRFLTSVATLAEGETILTGNERMCKRPIKYLIDVLNKLGVKTSYLSKDGYPPVKILSKLKGGAAQIRGDVSSQYFSSILMCAPYAKEDVMIDSPIPIKSRPYIDITIEMMRQFGVTLESKNNSFRVKSGQIYEARDYLVEGDFSSASYFFAATAVLGGSIRISGLNRNSVQGDSSFLNYMQMMGCNVICEEEVIILERDIRQSLRGIDVDLSHSPDLVQTLAVVACFAESSTTIRNIAHLKYKETNRIESLKTELNKIGATVQSTNSTLTIYPIKKPKSVTIETYNDHRMAMSLSIAGLKIPGIVIKDPSCVKKSFPTFFDVLQQICEERLF